MARARFAAHRVVGALPRLLAFGLIGECCQPEHDLVSRGVDGPLPVLHVKEQPHVRLDDLLQRERRRDRLASEA